MPSALPTGPRYTPQLEYELNIITARWALWIIFDRSTSSAGAKRNGIPVGPGRVSAAGSVVSYCLHITDVDPIKYSLFF